MTAWKPYSGNKVGHQRREGVRIILMPFVQANAHSPPPPPWQVHPSRAVLGLLVSVPVALAAARPASLRSIVAMPKFEEIH